MSETQQLQQQPAQQSQAPAVNPIRSFFNSDSVKGKFAELLGKRAPAFITSVLQAVNSNDLLKKADVTSIYNAAATAASLNLPVNSNLQQSAIIPYYDNKRGINVAQFQIMWKGYIQLAQRTGQYEIINVEDVREGELKDHNRLTGELKFEWVQDIAVRNSLPIVGFVAYFRLKSGFSKAVYRTAYELNEHGKKYSKTYSQSSSKWKTDFEAMCKKTVIKELLGKYGPLEVDSQIAMAIKADQSVIKADGEYDYPDSQTVDGYAETVEEQTDNRAKDAINAALNQAKS